MGYAFREAAFDFFDHDSAFLAEDSCTFFDVGVIVAFCHEPVSTHLIENRRMYVVNLLDNDDPVDNILPC